MPKAVDRARRRSEFVAATWRVIRREGLPAATLRRVAAEARCTTGALTHYFDSRDALLVAALRTAHEAARARMTETAARAGDSLERLEAVVTEALPLDRRRLGEWQTRLAFWSVAAESETLRRENAKLFDEWSRFLDGVLAPLVPRAEARRREVVLLQALIDGLGLRLVLHRVDAATELRGHLRALLARVR